MREIKEMVKCCGAASQKHEILEKPGLGQADVGERDWLFRFVGWLQVWSG